MMPPSTEAPDSLPCLRRSEIPTQTTIEFVCTQIAVPILFLGGIVGNCLVVFVSCNHRVLPRLRFVTTCVLSLMVWDCTILTSAVLLFTLPQVHSLFLRLVPVTFGITHIARTASVWTLVVVSIERFCAVWFPLRHQVVASRRTNALTTVVILSFCAIAYGCPRFFELTIRELSICDNPNSSYQFAAGRPHRISKEYTIIYIFVLNCILMFATPFIVIFVLNALIYTKIRSAVRRREAMVDPTKPGSIMKNSKKDSKKQSIESTRLLTNPRSSVDPESTRPLTKPRSSVDPESTRPLTNPRSSVDPESTRPLTNPRSSVDPESTRPLTNPRSSVDPESTRPSTKARSSVDPESTRPLTNLRSSVDPGSTRPLTNPRSSVDPAKPTYHRFVVNIGRCKTFIGQRCEHTMQRSTTIMLLVEALFFLACNAPSLCANVVDGVAPTWPTKHPEASRTLQSIGNILVLLRASMHFGIYYTFGTKFREDLRSSVRNSRNPSRLSASTLALRPLNVLVPLVGGSTTTRRRHSHNTRTGSKGPKNNTKRIRTCGNFDLKDMATSSIPSESEVVLNRGEASSGLVPVFV